MLQKGFFMTEPFNPYPYWENTVLLNLSGSTKFEEDTVFPAGKYLIDVQAGASRYLNSSGPQSDPVGTRNGVGGRVYQTIDVTTPFIIRAYCGSMGEFNVGGTNPYNGEFKVNASSQNAQPAMVSHIFGNAGGAVATNDAVFAGSGNCLGNGAVAHLSNLAYSIGAGSCLHILPELGVFGTDYLFAFHCSAGSCGFVGTPNVIGGSGSAYGGAGASSTATQSVIFANNGGSTLFGTGGTLFSGGSQTTKAGNDGSGVGAGFGGGRFLGAAAANTTGERGPQRGAAAWFDGSNWLTSSSVGGMNEQGHIIITYKGPVG